LRWRRADPKNSLFSAFTSRTVICCCEATLGDFGAVRLALTWFTPFIVTGLGFSQKVREWISGACLGVGASVLLTGGYEGDVDPRYTTRGARGVLGSTPLIRGGRESWPCGHVKRGGLRCAAGGGSLGGGNLFTDYVSAQPCIGEFTPVSQRGAVSESTVRLLRSRICTVFVMGSVIQVRKCRPRLHDGFTIQRRPMAAWATSGIVDVAQHRTAHGDRRAASRSFVRAKRRAAAADSSQ